MSTRQRVLWGVSTAVILGCLISSATVERERGLAQAALIKAAPRVRRAPLAPTPGDVFVSRTVYAGTASTVTVGQALPGGGNAVANGAYPDVFLNAGVDGSFGITSPIFIDREAVLGSTLVPVQTLAVPTSSIVTSFSSKSELGLELSTDGRFVTFMGYESDINQLDVSNSNTPNHVDPTNPVSTAVQRAVAQFDASDLLAGVTVTPVNAYSGNNGRSAIYDAGTGLYYMVGNAGNGGSPEPVAIVQNTGVQIVPPGGGPESTVVGVLNGTPGAKNGFQYGFAVQSIGDAADKSGKDDNYRGLTIFNNTLYCTKGSGGNGVNTVYQVGSAGTLPTLATAAATPITILPGFSTTLAKAASGVTNPFGIWFANATTLYVADEGSGSPGPNPNAGIGKWVLANGTWTLSYTLQAGLNHGVPYSVAGLDPSLNPAPDGIRRISGRDNGDGTVTIFGVTSTVSASGDQGADPNQLVAITDTLSFATAADAAGESFTVLRTAVFGECLRGVQCVPVSPVLYAQQLVGAALDTIQGLAVTSFKHPGDQDSMIALLQAALAALPAVQAEASEALLRNVLDRAGDILDPNAQATVVLDLEGAQGVLP